MNNHKYNHNKIEKIIQERWIKEKTFSVTENKKKEKFYCLPMLPYPSGKLHMGHVRNYTISDVISRYQRMLGKNVLHPIGWDAFGLPAEETAVKNNTSPKKWTYKNISIMKKQLQSLGFSYDWSREITTCKPEYYRWEQLFFIKLLKKKLIYKKKTLVNWCEFDKTVLANEQAQKGVCWRCGTKVKLKNISQWFIKITEYAEELLKDLSLLQEWPKEIVEMQKNWIGKSTGIIIKCLIFQTDYFLKIYTTKPETILDATFFAISMYHPLINVFLKNNKNINKFLKKNKYISYLEFQNCKKLIGIDTSLFVLHPITKKKLPLWITNYVKYNYATGAIIAVPNSNKTDYNFAKLYNLPIKYKSSNQQEKFKKNTSTLINSKKISRLQKKNARIIISNQLIKNKQAKRSQYYKIQDWCISRQRYWGTPIPIIYNNKGKYLPVSKKKLPVILKKYINKNNIIEFKNSNDLIKKKPKKEVIQETDTFDTFIESSWYYARYTNPHFNLDILDSQAAKYWLPVDQYIGGIEHAVMHLIYFRFYHKLLRDFGYVNSPEPVKKLICQGMVVVESFYMYNTDGSKKWLKPSELKIKRNRQGKIINVFKKSCLSKVIYAGKIKMSKSKNNGIDPTKIIKKYGADTLRLFLMFTAPIQSSLEWNSNSIIGMHRFLNKLWNFTHSTYNNEFIDKTSKIIYEQKKIISKLQKIIIHVTNDIQKKNSYNTAIAKIIKFFNYIVHLNNKKKINQNNLQLSLKTIIKMLYPFTPHICFALWRKIYKKNHYIDFEKWPEPRNDLIISDKTKLVIQVNGKKKSLIKIKKNLTKKEVIQLILNKKEIKQYFYNTVIKKIIYIPKKIINFVLIQNK
ncbi:leucine--tRNA ligase [Buchnera aphidicola]|uniref:Leucine--tRNA ligase n=1 Tax=Buchnera aphidicola (Cinara strobi) TaxID=1921549 RepID=A0A3B1DWM1_9GAMM|nr:leucine--tRNA ligase [Buchnera aphidicola]VAX76703.1 Leucine--tRNA ligase [Buchnera aphidicola (Cinara strobi)]